MNTPNIGGRKSSRANKTHVTKSGKTIKLNRSLSQRLSAQKSAKANRKALRQADLPKDRFKRFLYHFKPSRMYHYWFSRDGAIMALKLMGVGLVSCFLLLVGLFAYFRKDLPNLKDIYGNQFGGSNIYYDRSHKVVLYEDYDAVKRVPVKDDAISQYVKDATVAIEDKDFFKHGGFDVRGIMRAGVANLTGKSTQGGSTITQQLVKLTQNWSKDRSYTRKAKELILSVELERSYSKQEILAGYLNTAPYGNIQYGVEAASRDYFQKSAKDLTLDEAAFLAAIPKSPSYYSPYGAYYKSNIEESSVALVARQHYILKLMREQGKITKAEQEAATKVDTLAAVHEPQPKYAGIKAPWFVLAAKRQLEEQRGADSAKVGGWDITTTLDLRLQDIAEKQVAKGIAQVRSQGGDVAAFAAEDVHTGQMVAVVGGIDFNDDKAGANAFGKINYAQWPLPPGSSFKPYDYTTLIDTKPNVGAGSVIYDNQGPINGGNSGSYLCTNKNRPKNDKNANCLWDYDFYYPGPLTIRYALGGSRNVPAVKAMLMAGVDKTIDTAQQLGLKSGYKCYTDETNTTQGQCYLSAAIGDGAFLHLDEHVHGFASLSREGLNIPQTYILKIKNSAGKTISEWKPSKGKQVVKQESAYIVDDILSDPNASYFPSWRKPHRYNGWKFAMKTGTTNDAKDGWMMGFSTQYAAGVWVGHHTRQKVMSGTMEGMTQPIWQGWMRAAHDGLKPVDWEKPKGIQTLPAFVVKTRPSSKTAGAVLPSTSTDIFPSWYKPKAKTTSNAAVDKVSGKLATDCTPERAKDKGGNAAANQFSVDTVIAGSSSGGNDKDDIHKCTDAKPQISLNITSAGTSYNLSVNVTQGTHPISGDKFKGTVNYVVDGQIIRSFEVGGPGSGLAAFTYTPDFTGDKTIYAQIIDSVLYDSASTETTISGVSAVAFTATAANAGGGNYSVSWTGGSGTVSIFRSNGTTLICSALATIGTCPSTYPAINFFGGAIAKDSDGASVGVSGP